MCTSRSVAAVLCTVLAAGAVVVCAQTSSQPARCDGDIRVMSFNVRLGGDGVDELLTHVYGRWFKPRMHSLHDTRNYWRNRRGIVFDVIRRHEPDLIDLQEANRVQLDDIHAALPYYGEVGVGRFGDKLGEYCAILYRLDRFTVGEQGTFWFSETPEVPGSMHRGNKVPRICTWARLHDRRSKQAFYLFNVHFSSGHQAAREQSVRLLTERVASRSHPEPVILTGDFNAVEDNPVVLLLTGRPLPQRTQTATAAAPSPRLTDAFRTIHPNADRVGTYHDFSGRRNGPKVDYIFATPGVTILDADILHDDRNGQYPSDHFPVTAVLRLLPRTQP